MDLTAKPVLPPRRLTHTTIPATLMRLLLLALATLLPIAAAPAAAQAAVTISTMTPAEGPVSGGTFVTLTGTGLDTITGMTTLNGSLRRITSQTPTTLTFETGPGQAGSASFTFQSPSGPTAAPSLYQYYNVALSAFPERGPETGGTVIHVNMGGLDTITAVSFDNVPATIKSQSARSVDIIAPPASTPGGVTVWLTATNGRAAFPWTYDDVYLPPTLTSLTPSHGFITGGNSVVIAGTNLEKATSVKFGATSATIQPGTKTATSLTVTAPAGAVGTQNVTVTNPDDTSATSASTVYTYDRLPTPPTVTSLTPNHGLATGGNSVVIVGTNLSTVTAVKFGTTAATIGAKTAASLTVTAPAGAVGASTVTVTNPDGTTAGNAYTYDAPVTPDPDTGTPDPGTGTPAPGTGTPAPGTGTPAPGSGIPDPGTGAPAPGTTTTPTSETLVPTLPIAITIATTPPATPALTCGALALKGQSLVKAKSAIKRAGCRLGTVKKPKRVKPGFKLVVATAKLVKGSTTKLDLTLVAKRR